MKIRESIMKAGFAIGACPAQHRFNVPDDPPWSQPVFSARSDVLPWLHDERGWQAGINLTVRGVAEGISLMDLQVFLELNGVEDH